MDKAALDQREWTGLHEAGLRALAASPGRRVEKVSLGGRSVWVKRFGATRQPLAKRLHALVSPVLLPVHLRASRALDARGRAEREARKIARFSAAGFPTPEVLWRENGALVLSDVGESVKGRLARLGRGDPAAHDALIVGAGRALGSLHSAGLCHGRPHPRDLFVDASGRIGFLDFEEEPEAVIPLAVAQARDLWQFFLHVSLLRVLPGTLDATLAAYRAQAPEGVLPQVRPLLRVFRPAAALGLLLPAALVRPDYQRIIAVSSFLETLV